MAGAMDLFLLNCIDAIDKDDEMYKVAIKYLKTIKPESPFDHL